MKHRETANPETDGAADEEPAKCAAANPLAHGVRPGAKQPDGEQQAQAIGRGAAKMQRRAPRAHGVAGEEQCGEKCAGHRLYDGRAV